MLQAHYRSTLDISNDALKAADKGLSRLLHGIDLLNEIQPGQESSINVIAWREACYSAMNDDFNSPVLISHLFDGVKFINNTLSGKAQVSKSDLTILTKTFHELVFDVLGLQKEELQKETDKTNEIIELLISLRNDARSNNDFAFSDKVRDGLADIGIAIKDSKEGTTWSYES
jgi:cysteinyl-tRNA synthetase